MKRYTVPVLVAIASVLFVVTQQMIFIDTPIQVSNGPGQPGFGSSLFFNYKIFFYHVSHAFMLFLAVGVSGVCSIVYLAKRNPKWDDVALASAEVAVAFGAVVLATGSIWAKAAWDHWWIWENRLTMSLLLWLTLVGYVLVRRFAGPSGDRLAAGMAIFGMIGVPFIYTMVNRDDSHPQAGAGGNVATLDPALRGAFWLSVLTFFAWFLALTISRVQSARAEREVRELREQGLDAGVFT
jgi:heme exporter protein C